MQFFPKDNQIDYGPKNKYGQRKRTIGIHGIYTDQYTQRESAIKSNNINTKSMTNGCINAHDFFYGELRDHLDIGSSVYVS